MADKRPLDEDEKSEDEEWVGPMPSEAVQPKKRKVLEYEQVYLRNLPSAEAYEISYMHRDVITHIAMAATDFLVTASCDGHVKFWKKKEDDGIEFVKHFRAHLGAVMDLSVSCNGELCCTIADDKTLKVFDVVSFDMINMVKLDYVPSRCCWIFSPGDPIPAVAIAEMDANMIRVYHGQGGAEPIKVLDALHMKPVSLIKYNVAADTVVSMDTSGMLECWTGPRYDYEHPKCLQWEYKTDTDLYEFMKCKTIALDIAFSPDGKIMAAICKDRKVRLFKFLTGKITKVLDDSLHHFSKLQESTSELPNMEFGRRIAMERELERSPAFAHSSITFDSSGHFILYATMMGVKVINLTTNRCVKFLGKLENARFLQIALFQGTVKKAQAAHTLEMEASDNPALRGLDLDPCLFCTAFKKNRFYVFSRREPLETKDADQDRDVLNEKPTKEEIATATENTVFSRLGNTATIHTSMGDIMLKLFPKECPKAVENFCVHSREGYYNGHVFHRIIKSFMIQTGDPQGNGTGGESIWGGEFEDEFHPTLRHDRPYTVSMANAGPDSNGSQFFITVAPTPWLDNKHTVFGRATHGMETVQKISSVRTDPKTDKPLDEITIINITIR
ncbi:hypothetical protein CAPTEDRAFT_160326 [Capitella teleta]|uniref:peptidylprolyl isomerase n=1 Tax=Capitella teleta TaxID=283909 RepID=R7VKR8_CAPTE|nr:hypothetical protein CAPTEDRAFT_160326 [Capitella teleta]|eukprot:ELU17611.1 hypothetical protein CAPTEDRAFT_160326 [Capitella teleta]